MKKNKVYSSKELEILKDIESGKYKSLGKKDFAKEKNRLQKIAGNTLKRRAISIRVFESDISKIKAIALNEGMPYQTFITSIIHKIAIGRIKNYG